MARSSSTKSKKILVVARWPLGGIRTYMRYLFKQFPDNYVLTLLATSTQEDAALTVDAQEYGASLILVKKQDARGLAGAVLRELWKNRYDVILSQGFMSAVVVHPANVFFRVPHVMTIHGIVEPRYLTGRLGGVKRFLLGRVLANVAVLYAVGGEILRHVFDEFPCLQKYGPRAVVIYNGVDVAALDAQVSCTFDLRSRLGLDRSIFLFGFFGRMMKVKGFDLLIEAVHLLQVRECTRKFAVVAVGSGDYLEFYRKEVAETGCEEFFHFLPFQPQMRPLYSQVDAVVMPSRSEACSLVAMEALCMGRPLITSDCTGLRETVRDTPAMMFPSEDAAALADALQLSIADSKASDFECFSTRARERFDVVKSADQLIHLIEQLTGSGG